MVDANILWLIGVIILIVVVFVFSFSAGMSHGENKVYKKILEGDIDLDGFRE